MTIHHCSQAQLLHLKFIQRREIVFPTVCFYWWWIISAGLIISLLSAPTRDRRMNKKWEEHKESHGQSRVELQPLGIYIFSSRRVLPYSLSLCEFAQNVACYGRKNTYTRASKRGDSTPGRKVSLGLERNHSSSNSFIWIAKCKLDDAAAYVRFEEQKTKLIVNYYKKFHFLNRHWGRNSFYFFL